MHKNTVSAALTIDQQLQQDVTESNELMVADALKDNPLPLTLNQYRKLCKRLIKEVEKLTVIDDKYRRILALDPLNIMDNKMYENTVAKTIQACLDERIDGIDNSYLFIESDCELNDKSKTVSVKYIASVDCAYAFTVRRKKNFREDLAVLIAVMNCTYGIVSAYNVVYDYMPHALEDFKSGMYDEFFKQYRTMNEIVVVDRMDENRYIRDEDAIKQEFIDMASVLSNRYDNEDLYYSYLLILWFHYTDSLTLKQEQRIYDIAVSILNEYDKPIDAIRHCRAGRITEAMVKLIRFGQITSQPAYDLDITMINVVLKDFSDMVYDNTYDSYYGNEVNSLNGTVTIGLRSFSADTVRREVEVAKRRIDRFNSRLASCEIAFI